jgi:hypothetical protein
MGSSHGPKRPPQVSCAAHTAARDQAIAFLTDRMTEDLARLWPRDSASRDPRRPGLPAQLAVVDELLGLLSAGELPPVPELRMLLFGYGAHPAYDPRWTDLLVG